MKHMIFTLFGSIEQAESVLREADADAECHGRFRARVHRQQFVGTRLEPDESAAPAATRYGLVSGMLAGAVLSALLAGPLGLVGGAPLWAALIGGAAGGILGAFYGAWQGSNFPDPNLRKLAERQVEGKVLVSVASTSGKAQRRIETILREHGAPAMHRSVI